MTTDRQSYCRNYARRKRKKVFESQGYVPLYVAFGGSEREPGYKSLAVAILEQALLDYFILYRAKKVKELHIIDTEFMHGVGRQMRRHIQGIYPEDAEVLVNFLSGKCSSLLDLAMIDNDTKRIDGELIKRGVLHMESVGNVYSVPNQHISHE